MCIFAPAATAAGLLQPHAAAARGLQRVGSATACPVRPGCSRCAGPAGRPVLWAQREQVWARSAGRQHLAHPFMQRLGAVQRGICPAVAVEHAKKVQRFGGSRPQLCAAAGVSVDGHCCNRLAAAEASAATAGTVSGGAAGRGCRHSCHGVRSRLLRRPGPSASAAELRRNARRQQLIHACPADRHFDEEGHRHTGVLHLRAPPNHRLAAKWRAGMCHGGVRGRAWLPCPGRLALLLRLHPRRLAVLLPMQLMVGRRLAGCLPRRRGSSRCCPGRGG